MRMKLLNQNLYRQLALLPLIALVLLFSLVAEIHHQQIDLASWMGPAAQSGETPSNVEVEVILTNTVLLAVRVLPAVVLDLLPALLALALIPRLAARFIHSLYATKDVGEARKFLQRSVFGLAELRPPIIIREGRVAVGAGTLYNRVGGRTLLIVYNDSAAVLEKGGRLTRVVGGPYFGFLERFERVWEVVDLRHQRWVLAVDAMTKEGIPISCEADITFKIDDRFVDQAGNVRTKPPSEAKTELPTDRAIAEELKKTGIGRPLPYTKEAVLKAATSLWVRIQQPDHPEQLRHWTGRVVIGEVEGTLRDILARYRLDWLMRPPRPGHKHPREDIRDQLEGRLDETMPVGNKLGARILNVDLGKIDVKDESISRQWIEAWQAGWEQRAVESRAEGEARLARLHAAQVAAQAEMVVTLTEAIRPLVTSTEDLPSFMLARRFVETLRWMAYDPLKRVFLPPETLRACDQLEQVVSNASAALEEPISTTERMVMEGRKL